MYIVQYLFFPIQYYQGNKKSFIHAMGEIYIIQLFHPEGVPQQNVPDQEVPSLRVPRDLIFMSQ